MKECVLETPTLLHLAALNNHIEVVEFLKQRLFPPIGRYKRILHYNTPNFQDMLPEDMAGLRGYASLRGKLYDYRKVFEVWVKDINSEQCSLDFTKLCICGHPRVGKSSLKASLSKKEAAPSEGESPNTFGIDVSQVNVLGTNFSVWDFAGQVDSFITHQFFISTESTIFTVIVNLTTPFEEQKEELRWWLSFIKTRNLGQVSFLANSADSGNYVPMPCTPEQPPKRPLSSGPPDDRRGSVVSEESMFGNVVLQVPVVVIGSHYDLLPPTDAHRALDRLQDFAIEMRDLFKLYLGLSDRVLPLACHVPKSEEMTRLKQELVSVRTKLMKVQPQYPRVAMMIVNRIEKLKSEQPKLKVIVWEQFVEIIHSDVNRLITERQLSYLCKCLANAGVVVYFDQGALGNYVFIDPLWLCRDVLGKALAPEGFPQAQIAPLQAPTIKEDVIKAQLAKYMDNNHVNVILELLQRFDLCHLDRRKKTYLFPSFSKECFDHSLWQPDNGLHYIGRRLSCEDETDTFPPGFLSRLQVQVYKLLQMDQTMHMFSNNFLVEVGGYQCLVKLSEKSKVLDIVGRTKDTHTQACLALIDMVQGAVAALIKTSCPTVFLNIKVISCSDLQAHSDDPIIYTTNEVIRAESVVNNRSGKMESLVDLLYFGNQSLKSSYSLQHTPISHIREEDIEKLEELLDDGEKTWRDLAKELGLAVYVKLLEGKKPHSTRMLMLKYGERPKWTLESLLSALKKIDRLDAWALLRSHYLS